MLLYALHVKSISMHDLVVFVLGLAKCFLWFLAQLHFEMHYLCGWMSLLLFLSFPLTSLSVSLCLPHLLSSPFTFRIFSLPRKHIFFSICSVITVIERGVRLLPMVSLFYAFAESIPSTPTISQKRMNHIRIFFTYFSSWKLWLTINQLRVRTHAKEALRQKHQKKAKQNNKII